LEEHLAECEACQGYLRWLSPAVDLLPASVEQMQPPRRLGRNLMGTIRAEAKEARDAQKDRRRGFGWPSWRGVAFRPATVLAAAAVLAGGLAIGYAVRGSEDAEHVQRSVIAAERLPGSQGPVQAELEREGDSGTLRVTQMPPPPGDQVYQAWIERDGEVSPSGTFVVERDGSANAVVDGSLAGADSVLVTVEPRGGSPQPTSDPVLQVPLS
jgi:anti-sigma-K factor RskA